MIPTKQSLLKRTLGALYFAVLISLPGCQKGGCEKEFTLAEKVLDKPIYDYNGGRHLSEDGLNNKRRELSQRLRYQEIPFGQWPENASGVIIEWETESAKNIMYLNPNQTFMYTPKKGFAILTAEDITAEHKERSDPGISIDERTYFGPGGARGPIVYRRARKSVKPDIAYEDPGASERFEALDRIW